MKASGVRVTLDIQDPAMRMTLGFMLKAAGHHITDSDEQVTISDNSAAAIKALARGPSLVLATASGITDAVEAMRHGVYGYIFIPLQPGEAALMVERAVGSPPDELKEACRDDVVESTPDLADLERRHILKVLQACKGNQAKAAQVLGIGRNTLWRKLRRYENLPFSD
jgi:DNA-binding NtrC family response regulator